MVASKSEKKKKTCSIHNSYAKFRLKLGIKRTPNIFLYLNYIQVKLEQLEYRVGMRKIAGFSLPKFLAKFQTFYILVKCYLSMKGTEVDREEKAVL